MLDKDRWEQIAASLSGNLSEQGEKNLQSWISSSDENKNLYEQAKLIWNNSEKKFRIKNVSTEKQWEELTPFLDENSSSNQTNFKNISIWLKVAASITLLFLCVYAFQVYYNNSTTFVANNEVMTLYLPDSTRVWLNVNSTLSYADNFNKNARNVTLKGEAFFAVKRDTTRKFIVTTKLATVQVLGTSFNVQESDSISTILTVAEGVVKFASKVDQSKDEKVIAGEKAVYTKGSHAVVKSQNDKIDFARWREKNNPRFELEKIDPAKYLSNTFSWKKNQINLSVIEGRLTNRALLTAYTQIVLRVTYTNPKGKNIVTRVTIFDEVPPGETIDYSKRLLDIFTDTQSLQTEVESAHAISNSKY